MGSIGPVVLVAVLGLSCRRSEKTSPSIVKDDATQAPRPDCPAGCSSGFCWEGFAEHRLEARSFVQPAFAGHWLLWADSTGLRARHVRTGESRTLATGFVGSIAAKGDVATWQSKDKLQRVSPITGTPIALRSLFCTGDHRLRHLRVVGNAVLTNCDTISSSPSGFITDVAHGFELVDEKGLVRPLGVFHRDVNHGQVVVAGLVLDGNAIVFNAGSQIVRRPLDDFQASADVVVHDFDDGFVLDLALLDHFLVADYHAHAPESRCDGQPHRLYALSRDAPEAGTRVPVDLGSLRIGYKGLVANKSHILATSDDKLFVAAPPRPLREVALSLAPHDAAPSSQRSLHAAVSDCGTVALVDGDHHMLVHGVENW